MIVVDASAVLELLLRTGIGLSVEARLFRDDAALHAPHLLDVEVLQALRKLVRRRDVRPARAREALEDLAVMGVMRHPHLDLAPRVWELRANLTACDGVYVALAEALDAPLVTCDARLAGSSGHRAEIECCGGGQSG